MWWVQASRSHWLSLKVGLAFQVMNAIPTDANFSILKSRAQSCNKIS
jgi:hypothetical protein